MTNRPLEEHQFVAILKQNIRPAQPIDSPDLLQGRATILRDIGRTLHLARNAYFRLRRAWRRKNVDCPHGGKIVCSCRRTICRLR